MSRGGFMLTLDSIAEIQEKGFCVLKANFPRSLIEACRQAFWPILLEYIRLHHDQPNRGPHRHFLPMPFTSSCFAPECFFDSIVLQIVRGVMDERVVADQYGCEVPIKGSTYQRAHVDYQRPLFPESPELVLPPYMLIVSFGLMEITHIHGPIEIAPGTHRMERNEALRCVQSGEIAMHPVILGLGDVLIRHPWSLHRGTPNITDTP